MALGQRISYRMKKEMREGLCCTFVIPNPFIVNNKMFKPRKKRQTTAAGSLCHVVKRSASKERCLSGD